MTGLARLDEIESIERQAALLARSSIVPRPYQGKPADIIAASLLGRDIGWSPMTSMRFVQVIEGVATISAEGLVALTRAAGHHITGEVSGTAATVTGRRGDTGDEMTVTFSLDDAVTAGLCTIRDGAPYSRSKNGRRLPWEMYPKAMLWARAVSQLCRMLFADVTVGMAYVPEEITPPEVDESATMRAIEAATPPAEVIEEAAAVATITETEMRDLVAPLDALDDQHTRATVKQAFVARFGDPAGLPLDDLDDAVAWIDEQVMLHSEPFDLPA